MELITLKKLYNLILLKKFKIQVYFFLIFLKKNIE